jgi:cytochrome c biogenesis protein CcmG, thiol:disulfide interchange protein DsbE
MQTIARHPRRVLFAFLATLLVFGCGESYSASPSANLAKFKMKTLDGAKTMGPSDFAGKVVVVDFWATWCGPCHIQAKILEKVRKDFEGENVQFLAANTGESADRVKSFVKDKPFSYPVLVDTEDVAGDLGVFALPTLLVIDTKGKVAYFEAGLVDADTIRKVLKKAGS